MPAPTPYDIEVHEDQGKFMRKSHTNPDILTLYGEFLLRRLREKSHHLLHTQYHMRARI